MIVNGKEMNFESLTILKLLENLSLDMNKVVVEVNLEIVSKEDYSEYLLNKEDKIEIISFVGGG
ncbi:sulfur carrier protein ThiS [Wukongibacter baidiensis]|uniref:sulfur carrier protein ThiS n=1 Tax=Wukongibacter baidiensis TaxID=1723361 RepID=UPI003D7F511C